MNKKFLSAILFGALMVTSTGTFVSCKDYDDDIENLQGQIDKLATKEDLSSQIATLQSALNNAASNATDAIAKATAAEAAAKAAGDEAAAAKAAAEKTAAEAEAKAIEAAKATVESTKAELEDLVAAGMAENKTELEKMAAKVDEATKQVEEIVGSIADMVTSVELVYSNNKQTGTYMPLRVYESIKNDEGEWWKYWSYTSYVGNLNDMLENIKFNEVYDEKTGELVGYNWVQVSDNYGNEAYDGQWLYTQTVVEKENTFGPNETSFIKFTKDLQHQRGDKFIVRVSPTNAVLTPEMISLVNSQGQVLDMLEVKSVKNYDGLLTRSVAGNGLWEVEVALKEYEEKAFSAVQYKENTGYILYAVQVNNTQATAPARNVISSYDLSLGNHSMFYGLNYLNFFVNDTNVEYINNRVYNMNSNSFADRYNSTYKKDCYKEMEWRGNAAVAPIVNKKGHNVYVNGVEDYINTGSWYGFDNRGGQSVYPAVQGVPMTITLSLPWYYDKVRDASQYIRGLYVTLDTKNAVESAPSELNAWNSYTYEGLNKVVEGTSTTITINAETAINDIIGFRVYAVNWDGTLVDPDGRAFYVRLGDKANEWAAAATTIVPVNETVEGVESDKIAATTTKLTGASYAKWTTSKIGEDNTVFNAYFVDKDGNVLYSTADKNNFPEDFSKVAKVYTEATGEYPWTSYEDDKEYGGTLEIYNGTNHMIATMNISMTKKLPETVPAGFSVKTAQLVDNVYNCYLVPDAWTAGAAEVGKMDMDDVFNWGAKAEPARYEITFANAAWDGEKLVNVAPNGTSDLVVAKDYTDADGVVKALIDNTTEHATTVVYNYGQISSVKDADGVYVFVKRTAAEFATIFNCIYNSTYTWRWATHEDLGHTKNANGVWSGSIMNTKLTYGTDLKGVDVAGLIFGDSSKDNLYDETLNPSYKKSLKIKEAHLVSNGNKEVDEYFKVIWTAGTTEITEFDAVLVSSDTNPNAAVESTLVITVLDMYNHEIVIELPMTVNPR